MKGFWLDLLWMKETIVSELDFVRIPVQITTGLLIVMRYEWAMRNEACISSRLVDQPVLTKNRYAVSNNYRKPRIRFSTMCFLM